MRTEAKSRGVEESKSRDGVDIGVYVHFPFCLSKCAYCDFASYALDSVGGLKGARRYVEALGVEMDRRAASAEFAGATVATIYLGGGTPTLLPAEWIGEVLARVRLRFPVLPEAEISIEANPGTVDREKLAALHAAGINRLSFGVQSFREEELQLLGRKHTAVEAVEAYTQAREAGFENLGLDLIYGLPGQEVADWQESLERAVELAPEHISAYGLSLEEGTPLSEAVKCRERPEPEEEVYAHQYLLTEERLAAAGYEHYEIANFSQPGKQCFHNRNYWLGGEYLGLGSAAHSHRGGSRWSNTLDPAVYLDALARGVLPVVRAEALSARARAGELLMLGLRRAEGVGEAEIAAQSGVDVREAFGEQITRLLEQGLLEESGGGWHIPRDKWLVSNEALAEFVD